jgi:hypothetical protein
MNVVRAMSSEGWGRAKYHGTIRRLLDTDAGVRGFLEGQTDRLPSFYSARIERDLGDLYRYLPPGAVMHDPNAYLKSVEDGAPVAQLQRGRQRPRAVPAAVPGSATTPV